MMLANAEPEKKKETNNPGRNAVLALFQSQKICEYQWTSRIHAAVIDTISSNPYESVRGGSPVMWTLVKPMNTTDVSTVP